MRYSHESISTVSNLQYSLRLFVSGLGLLHEQSIRNVPDKNVIILIILSKFKFNMENILFYGLRPDKQ